MNLFLIQDWQFFQALYGIIGAAIASAVLITIFLIRLEGKVKLLQRLLNEHMKELNRQRDELSGLTRVFRDVGIQLIVGSIKKGDDKQVG